MLTDLFMSSQTSVGVTARIGRQGGHPQIKHRRGKQRC
jgi:hypothetical protein